MAVAPPAVEVRDALYIEGAMMTNEKPFVLLAQVLASPTRPLSETGTEEAALIRKIVGGQRDLFGDLIAPHLTPLLRTVRATMGGHVEVDDIVQQTVLKAFTRLAQFRFEAGFRTWLIQIGLNEIRQWRRKHTSSPFVESTPAAELLFADQSDSPLIECQRNESSAQLSAALARLPEKYRNVIVLRDLEGLRVSEVAVRLGLTIPAVKTRHSRARQKVAEFLERARKFGRRVALADDSSTLRPARHITRKLQKMRIST
jgi:RNA polymerase sigma-70 factor (ECF subfamily)